MPDAANRPCAVEGCRFVKPCPVHRGRVRLYNLRAWRSASRAWRLLHPFCAMGCGRRSTQVDHVVAHMGDERLFWSSDNWQALCAACHAKKGASEKR